MRERQGASRRENKRAVGEAKSISGVAESEFTLHLYYISGWKIAAVMRYCGGFRRCAEWCDLLLSSSLSEPMFFDEKMLVTNSEWLDCILSLSLYIPSRPQLHIAQAQEEWIKNKSQVLIFSARSQDNPICMHQIPERSNGFSVRVLRVRKVEREAQTHSGNFHLFFVYTHPCSMALALECVASGFSDFAWLARGNIETFGVSNKI